MTSTPALTPTGTTEWGTHALDLEAYLDRIGQPAATPSATALSALHEAHVRTIPFENVDVLLGRGPSLELTDITAKLVHSRRGGYCFEHGLLFAAALDRLGYAVRRRIGRVNPDHPSSPTTHLVLLVHLDGTDFLADVGFGGGLLTPLPLTDGATTDHGGWRYRLTRDHQHWRLEKPADDGWATLHAFTDTPLRPIDYTVANHYTSTHPNSPFTRRLIVQRLDHGRLRKLVGHHRLTEYSDARPSQNSTVMPDDLDTTLREHDIVVDAADLPRLARVYAGE